MPTAPGRIYAKWRGKRYLIAETSLPGTITLRLKKRIKVDAVRLESHLHPDGTTSLQHLLGL